MLRFTIFLAVAVTLGCALTPTYVQSREAFTHVKTYIGQALAPQNGDVNDAETRKHYSFGILAQIVADMVAANKSDPLYRPLLVLDQSLPYGWRNYDTISLKAHSLLNEAAAKINLMEDLIDNLCDVDGVEQCNRKVHSKVIRNPFAFKLPSELLLLLGRFSESVKELEPMIETVTKERKEIPYLINNVETNTFEHFVEDSEQLYNKMRELHFRRTIV